MASDLVKDSAGSPATVGGFAGIYAEGKFALDKHYVVSISGAVALANPRTGALVPFSAPSLHTSADGSGAAYFDLKYAGQLVNRGGSLFAVTGAVSSQTIKSVNDGGSIDAIKGVGRAGRSLTVCAGVASPGITTEFVAPLRIV